MPIYEFYCADCHTVFEFLIGSTRTRSRPPCPRCARPRLERYASTFAVSRGTRERAAAAPPMAPDPLRLQHTIQMLTAQAERLPDHDRQGLARLISQPPKGLREALERLEAGDDPRGIEAEMGAFLDAEEAPDGTSSNTVRDRTRQARPRIDPLLHDRR